MEPDCKHKGYTKHVCKVCGDHFTDCKVSALGHDWEAHTKSVIVRQEQHSVCRACGQDLTALGLNADEASAHVKAHIMAGGRESRVYSIVVPIYEDVTTYVCSRCGAEK